MSDLIDDPNRGRVVDLQSDGLLWLINRTVFHPRGYALSAEFDASGCAIFRLLGDGAEPWRFELPDDDEDSMFTAAKAVLR